MRPDDALNRLPTPSRFPNDRYCVSAAPKVIKLAAACFLACATMLANRTLLAQEQLPPLKRLDDPTRAKALAALAGLVILGFGMVLLTWLAARVVQRYRRGSSYFRPTPRPGEHEWASQPLVPKDSEPPKSDA